MKASAIHRRSRSEGCFYGKEKRAAWLTAALVLLLAGGGNAGPLDSYTNPLGMAFVRLSPGTFSMGSPSREPGRDPSEIRHAVTLSEPFFMMTTEVTLGQWWAVMGKRWIGRRKGPPDLPVTRVSWFDAVRFINRLNDRYPGVYGLPTEAQWEYACRAGTQTAFAWGPKAACDKAMFANNPAKAPDCVEYARSRGWRANRPAPVKRYPPNAWGLFDMHGNVWEWCQDWYGMYPRGPVKDPRGPHSGKGKVRRGGSFFGPARLCRSANRAYAHPASRLHTTGFRLVWKPTGKKVPYAERPPESREEAPDGP